MSTTVESERPSSAKRPSGTGCSCGGGDDHAGESLADASSKVSNPGPSGTVLKNDPSALSAMVMSAAPKFVLDTPTSRTVPLGPDRKGLRSALRLTLTPLFLKLLSLTL